MLLKITDIESIDSTPDIETILNSFHSDVISEINASASDPTYGDGVTTPVELENWQANFEKFYFFVCQ